MEPDFLNLAEVLEIHRDQIERYGGDPGLLDLGLLQSAIAMPMATFAGRFLHPDLYAMAAAYLFHLVMDHPFLDGNKRTGTVAALVFLDLNGVAIRASESALEKLVLSVAKGKADKARITTFLREHTSPADQM